MIQYKPQTISIHALVEYPNNIFSPYEGQRMDDLISSIAEHGILSPITVRPLDENKFQILSGHNRYRAAKQLELTEIPYIVKEVSDNEAAFIVTESNLIQRSFNDLKHSERAIVLRNHLEHVKSLTQQGKRNDLIGLIDEGAQLAHKSKSRDKIAEQYSLSKDTVSRYVRLAKLPIEMLQMIDEKRLKVIPAVELSWLSDENIAFIVKLIDADAVNVSLEKAKRLRAASANSGGNLSEKEITNILVNKATVNRPLRVSLSVDIRERLTAHHITSDKIDEIINIYLNLLEKGEVKSVMDSDDA